MKLWSFCLAVLASSVFQIEGASKNSEDDSGWESYLAEIYDLFASFPFQNSSAKYNVKNLADWGNENAEQGLLITANNFNEFTEILTNYGIVQPEGVDLDRKVRDFNDVIEATIGSQIEVYVDPESGARTILGNFIKTSDIYNGANLSEVFATDSIFIDKNIYMAADSLVTVMSQNWLVKHFSFNILDFLNQHSDFVGFGENFIKDEAMAIPEFGEESCANVVVFFTGDQTSDISEIQHRTREIVSQGVANRNLPLSEIDKPIKPHCTVSDSIVQTDGSYNKGKAESFERYKSFLVKNYLKNRFLSKKLRAFLTQIDQQVDTSLAYDDDLIQFFVAELKELEEVVYTADDDIDTAFLYQLLAQKTGRALTKRFGGENEETQKILLYLYSSILGRVSSIQEDAEIYLITQLRDYSGLVIENIQDVKDFGKTLVIDRAVANYESELDQKSDDARQLVSSELQPRIQEITSELDGSLDELVAEIDELTQEAEAEEQALEEKKKQLLESLTKRIIFGVLNGVTSILSAFVPPAAIVEQVIGQTEDLFNTNIDVNFDTSKYDLPQLSEEASKFLEGLRHGNFTCVDLNQTDDSEPDLSEIAKELFDKLKDIGFDAYGKYRNDENILNIIEEEILLLQLQINNLHEMRNQVCDTLGPVVIAIAEDIENLQAALEGKSQAQLAIKEWQVVSSLKKTQNYLERYYSNFETSGSFPEEFSELTDIVQTMIKIYDIIDNYNQQKKLGGLLGEIASVKYGGIEISDPELKTELDTLDLYSKSNLVLLEYRRFSDAIIQYSFPLADLYFKKFDIPLAMSAKDNLESFTQTAVQKITDFRHRLWEESDTIMEFDDIKHSNIRFGDDGLHEPFFIWTKEEFGDKIASLLRGEEITIKADLQRSTHSKNAVKFNEIDLSLKTDQQELLNSALGKLEVSMIHTGNSYYKCNERLFTIGSSKQSIQFSFKKSSDGPETSNDVYDKLKNGDYILSPFTVWKIKLLPQKTDDLKALEEFVGKVDLELTGKGQYYEESDKLCTTYRMEKYYDEILVSTSADVEKKKFSAGVASTVTVNELGDIIIV